MKANNTNKEKAIPTFQNWVAGLLNTICPYQCTTDGNEKWYDTDGKEYSTEEVNEHFLSFYPEKTPTFKKGEKVIMHTCYESTLDKYKGKVWTCKTDSYLDKAKQDVVFLEGFCGCFSSEYLTLAK